MSRRLFETVALAAVMSSVALPATASTSKPVTTEEAQAADDYCGRSLGTWFYCERPAPAPEKQEPDADTKAVTPPEVAALEAFKKELEDTRAVAVWDPKPENIRRYYELQQVAMNRASLFSDNWRRMIWTSPELDYTLKRPVNTLGKRLWSDTRQGDRDLFLREASETVGLFYVFKGSCGACHVASPIVKNFSVRYGVPVTAVSGDGAGNEHFAKVVTDRGQLKAWGVGDMTPALLMFQQADPIVNGKPQQRRIQLTGGRSVTLRACRQPRGCLTYIGAGVMPVEDIAERLYVLLATEPGQDF
ncbi:conjugal transfer protein TraF [Caulobacter sp. 17J65-9]|uniref:conjugal transfer protein TraF n=1 Tax=Caulobacter sp. 17J65-9 TaxID=2709382 RepID=UPI0013C9DF85|nr:conjugal transfer protein TraF [Caulobacter sp. 17J65-9]NEX91205.1 conjugal transfer protein TraF [Caulobacter sp. 17J65-9]